MYSDKDRHRHILLLPGASQYCKATRLSSHVARRAAPFHSRVSLYLYFSLSLVWLSLPLLLPPPTFSTTYYIYICFPNRPCPHLSFSSTHLTIYFFTILLYFTLPSHLFFLFLLTSLLPLFFLSPSPSNTHHVLLF